MFLNYVKSTLFLIVSILSFYGNAMLRRVPSRPRVIRNAPVSRNMSSRTLPVAVQALRERHNRKVEIERMIKFHHSNIYSDLFARLSDLSMREARLLTVQNAIISDRLVSFIGRRIHYAPLLSELIEISNERKEINNMIKEGNQKLRQLRIELKNVSK